jgi:single-strand DNA-binding protein
MNKVVLIGRLTKDPELKYTPGSGTAVTTLTLAVDRRYQKDSQQKEADFIPVVVWGKSAESTAQYMNKGKLMAVSGRIQTRSYEAKDGGKRYVTEVVADEVQFLEWGAKGSSSNEGGFGGNSKNDSGFGSSFDDMTPVDDGDIPF